jgi:hypothetical protein
MFWATFFHIKNCVFMDWATFLGDISRTHLVTLFTAITKRRFPG